MIRRLVPGLAFTLSVIAAAPGSADRPTEEAYVLHCSGCHGVDGAGVPGMVPSLRSLAGLLNEEGGRAYLARVPGVAQAPIEDRELADLLNWVMRELSSSRNFEAYTPDEIARGRSQPLRDPLKSRPGS